MKIICSSCGSKYTIADAKVKGKKVKVRCKSCKESILVDGTQISGEGSDDESDDEMSSAPQASLAPSPTDTAKVDPNLWSVNLSDDDSREMTLAQLVAGWKDGTVTGDAYVWKDGMGDWKPILEVGELKTKLGPAQARVAAPPAAKPVAKPKIAGDLFGSLESATGNTPGLGGPKPAETKGTGARNDSSVLFSLDSLTSPGGGGGSGSTAANLFGDLGTTSGPLTNDTDLLMAPPKDPPAAPIGARAVRPISMAPEKKGGKGLMIGAIVGALLLAGGAVFALGGDDGESQKLAAAEAETEKVTAEAEKAKADLEAAQEKMKAEQEKLKADLEKAKQEVAEEKKDDKKVEVEAKEKAEAEAKQAASSAPSTSSSSSSSPAPAKSPSPAAGGAFDVGAAKAALATAAANASSCAKQGGPKGAGKVQVTFSTSGRVTSANVVSGPFGGTTVGGCVASTFRRARVPAFSGAPTTVSKSFSIQ